MTDHLLTVDQAADYLQVEPTTVREWAKAGRIPGARQLGRLWRFDPNEIKNTGKVQCPSTDTRIQVTGGFDSPSVVERFASQRAQRTARRPRNTNTSGARSTGVRLTLVKNGTPGKTPPRGGSGSGPANAA